MWNVGLCDIPVRVRNEQPGRVDISSKREGVCVASES